MLDDLPVGSLTTCYLSNCLQVATSFLETVGVVLWVCVFFFLPFPVAHKSEAEEE